MKKFWIIALAILALACNKEDNNIEDIVECFPKVGSVAFIINDAATEKSEYCFSEDGKIHFIASYNQSYRLGFDQQGINEYFYDSLGQIERIESFIPGIVYMSSLNAFDHQVDREFTYENGKLVEIKETADYNLTDGSLIVQYLSYDYDENGKMIKETYESESNENGQPITKVTGYIEFTYDEVGDLESEKYYSNQDSVYTLSSIKKYEFDAYQNPLQFRPERQFENNLSSIEVTSYYNGDSSSYSIDYYYYYNENGFPISKEIYYNMEYSTTEYYAYFEDETDE